MPLSELDPEDVKKYKHLTKEVAERSTQLRHARITQAHAEGKFGMSASQVTEFMAAFEELCKDTRIRLGAPPPQGFMDVVDAAGVSEQDLMWLSMMLLQNKRDEKDMYWGRRLLYTLSAAGFIEATIRIMNHALIQHKREPGALRRGDIAFERGRLQKAAREGENSRALVLEGKVAYELGDVDTAISCWWQAVDGAVAKSKEIFAQRAAGKRLGLDISATDILDLSTPWIELIEAHFDRSLTKGKNEWELCEKAIRIGVEQDDPTAFYYAATYNKQRHEDGTHLPTSQWLYYMTKAAASGVPKAAYELGVYYAESGWKYIEDEPPEHVKPTPFDSYPGKDVSDSPWDRVRHMFSPPDPSPKDDKDLVWQFGAWPPTPEQRYDLAIRWLSVSAGYTYAPAYLFLAKLHMQETLWAGAQAPKEALELRPKRYLYASKEEEVDAHFTGDVKTHELPEDAEDPPNPDYDIELAKGHLLEVFLARQAVMIREKALAKYAKEKRDVEFDDIAFDRNEGSLAILKFLDNREVYDQWAKDSMALYNEAAVICEEMGWSIYDESGGLWYKAGLGAVDRNVYQRGAGSMERI